MNRSGSGFVVFTRYEAHSLLYTTMTRGVYQLVAGARLRRLVV